MFGHLVLIILNSAETIIGIMESIISTGKNLIKYTVDCNNRFMLDGQTCPEFNSRRDWRVTSFRNKQALKKN